MKGKNEMIMKTRHTQSNSRGRRLAVITRIALTAICGALPAALASDVRFASTNYRQPFGLDEIKVTIIRGTNLEASLEVQFRTLDGTARAGEHYVAQAHAVAFAEGQTNAEIAIPLFVSAGGNGDRTFAVQAADSFTSPSWQIEASITLVDTLHPGGVDPTFDAGRLSGSVPETGWYTIVEDFVALPDGKIFIGGHMPLRRVHPDGSLDEIYSRPYTDVPPLDDIHDLYLLPDGKVVAWWGAPVRFRADGTLDRSFLNILCLGVQPDGKLLGYLGANGGCCDGPMMRFHHDGTVDAGFNPIDVNWSVTDVVCQPDGKMLVVSKDQGIVRLRRYTSDGSLDAGFIESTFDSFTPLPKVVVSVAGLTILKFSQMEKSWRVAPSAHSTDLGMATLFVCTANWTCVSARRLSQTMAGCDSV
jgi:hypothetical protein